MHTQEQTIEDQQFASLLINGFCGGIILVLAGLVFRAQLQQHDGKPIGTLIYGFVLFAVTMVFVGAFTANLFRWFFRDVVHDDNLSPLYLISTQSDDFVTTPFVVANTSFAAIDILVQGWMLQWFASADLPRKWKSFALFPMSLLAVSSTVFTILAVIERVSNDGALPAKERDSHVDLLCSSFSAIFYLVAAACIWIQWRYTRSKVLPRALRDFEANHMYLSTLRSARVGKCAILQNPILRMLLQPAALSVHFSFLLLGVMIRAHMIPVTFDGRGIGPLFNVLYALKAHAMAATPFLMMLEAAIQEEENEERRRQRISPNLHKGEIRFTVTVEKPSGTTLHHKDSMISFATVESRVEIDLHRSTRHPGLPAPEVCE